MKDDAKSILDDMIRDKYERYCFKERIKPTERGFRIYRDWPMKQLKNRG